ncbi:NUDIX domain-containing protein [Streptomyces goshikiensis]|uniref:NUDIX domain-containing protein n=1 Tax=Streptomyces goshikiensis TaxID=1942 RepID=UPI0022F3E73A|nr:NUDIX hydrolase [Streptomyces goshikiensis]WBY25040.1 NUDIX hydrolase [Streptomyces goshikiensis]
MTASVGHAKATASAAALVRDEQGRVLIVNPVYKERWNLPGGHIEEGEVPTAALRRELREELGLDLEIGDLLVTAWVTRAEGSHVFYVFDGPQLSADEQQAISLQESEIGEVRFCLPEDISPSMIPPFALAIWRQALAAREAKRAAYVELAL